METVLDLELYHPLSYTVKSAERAVVDKRWGGELWISRPLEWSPCKARIKGSQITNAATPSIQQQVLIALAGKIEEGAKPS